MTSIVKKVSVQMYYKREVQYHTVCRTPGYTEYPFLGYWGKTWWACPLGLHSGKGDPLKKHGATVIKNVIEPTRIFPYCDSTFCEILAPKTSTSAGPAATDGRYVRGRRVGPRPRRGREATARGKKNSNFIMGKKIQIAMP
jgi:hypothetical protein